MLTGYFIAVIAFIVIVGISVMLIWWYMNCVTKLIGQFQDPTWWILAVVFFGWAALEWLIAHAVTLVWLGRAGSPDTTLPFTSLTPFLSQTPLRFSGRLLGYYGLSASGIVVLFCVIQKSYRRFLFHVVLLNVLIALGMWGLFRSPNGRKVHVATVSESVIDRVAPIKQPFDLVVFPEYGFDQGLRPTQRVESDTADPIFYIGSEEQQIATKRQNVLVFGSNHDGILEQRAKSRLIPGGEYLPYTADFALTLVGNQTKEFFKQNRAIARGQYNPTPLTANSTLRLGSSVCAGIIAPGDYQQFTKRGATILTNSAALGIFKSGLFTIEHRGMASFMATANARPFVQAANEADAFILNQNGNMVAHASPGGSRLAEAYVTTNARKTPYSIIGDWPVFVGFLIFTFLTVKKSAHIFVQK